MTSRNQREGYYSGYFRKHYRSRFHRLGQKYDAYCDLTYFVLLHPEPDLHTLWVEDSIDDYPGLQAAIGELGTIDRFRFITTS